MIVMVSQKFYWTAVEEPQGGEVNKFFSFLWLKKSFHFVSQLNKLEKTKAQYTFNMTGG
jgi:hypothetical protein